MLIARDAVFQHIPGGSVGWRIARRILALPGREPIREWVLVEHRRLPDGVWVPHQTAMITPLSLAHNATFRQAAEYVQKVYLITD